MSVRYCLGIHHKEIAGAIDPTAQDSAFVQLRGKLNALVPSLKFDEIVGVPSFAWTNAPLQSHVLAQLRFSGVDEAKRFRDAFSQRLRPSTGYGFGPDPDIFPLDAWPSFGPGGGIFGNRDDAEALTCTAKLTDRNHCEVTGKGVNVVIIDRGLDRAAVQNTSLRMAERRGLRSTSGQSVLGWTRYERPRAAAAGAIRYFNPGDSGSEHGYMIARNVLAIAPEATLWDAPLLPADDEPDGPPGPSSACQLFHLIRRAVRDGKLTSWDFEAKRPVTRPFTGPVVLVNAWGVMNPEANPEFSLYADDPDNQLVNDMTLLENEGIDVVFAAGNCGEPTPDFRCGREDRGPGGSIFGMNGHPSVLTVGAVRADGVPLALSAQGPGRLASALRARNSLLADEAFFKPDLCAPSHFREPDDAAETNTGTSAACGFAAGIVAALRSTKAGRCLKPAWLRALLRETAQPIASGGWDPRLGRGIINGANALAMIER